MKQITIEGTSRADLGKKATKAVRANGNVPCVLYGEKKDENGKPVAIHFEVSEKQINKLVFTPHIYLVDIKIDCDNDTLLVKANPTGPTCHTGTDTCWGETNEKNPLLFLTYLQDFINRRHEEMPEGSYTTSLFKDGLNRMAQKVGEEALEAVIEACNGTNERLVYEGSDMIYHLIVLLTSKGLRIEDLARELQVRHDPNWHKH